MKGRESGMPSQEMWEGFFEPAKILKILGLDESIKDAAEFGCGYGTFTIPAAKIIKGTVYGFDIDPEMIAITKEQAKKEKLQNIKTILRDFVAEGTGLKKQTIDYVMIFNLLHIEHPEILLQEAWRILRQEGKLGIIHWNYDASTPRGPSMDIRPKPEQCMAWASAAGFYKPERYDLKPYHYGIVMRKGSLK